MAALLLPIDWYWNPFYNLAFEEAIYRVSDGNVYVRLWRNENAVVIGRMQCAALELNINLAYKYGVRVVRRISGGGAVYHDMGNLNYTVVAPPKQIGARSLQEAYTWLARTVLEALGSLGVKAVYEPPLDVVIKGLKVAGFAAQWSNRAVLIHGTLLVETRPELVEGILLKPTLDMELTGVVRSRRRRVTRIADWAQVNVEKTCQALLDVLAEKLGNLQLAEPRRELIDKATALYKTRYSRPEWNLKLAIRLKHLLPKEVLEKLLELARPRQTSHVKPVADNPPCMAGFG